MLHLSSIVYFSQQLQVVSFLERDLVQIRTNQHRRCQYRGYNCRTALDQLSKRCRKLSQGSLSPYIMRAGSAIVPSMTSREAHPRSTATWRRIVGVAVGHFGQHFSPTKRWPKLLKKLISPTLPMKSKYEFLKRIVLHVTLPLSLIQNFLSRDIYPPSQNLASPPGNLQCRLV